MGAVIRGHPRINIPSANNCIYPGDISKVAGDDTSIGHLQSRLSQEVYDPGGENVPHNTLSLKRIKLGEESTLCGHTLAETNFRTRYSCMVIGREMENGELAIVEPQRPFEAGDILWVAGEDEYLRLLRTVMCNE